MTSRSMRYTVLAMLLVATMPRVALAAEDPLALIPENAAAGIATRSLNDLKTKGDRLIAETEMQMPGRPSQLFDIVIAQGLNIQLGADHNSSFAVVISSAESVGAMGPWDKIIERIVVAVPFTDLDKIASNFDLTAQSLKADRPVASRRNHSFVRTLYVRGQHLFLGNNEQALLSVVRGKSLGDALSPAQRQTLKDSDLLVHVGTTGWNELWKGNRRDLQASLEKLEKDKEAVETLLDSLETVRMVVAGVKIDRGLNINLLTLFPKDQSPATRRLLSQLQAGSGAADLQGLPQGDVVAAHAVRGDGAQNSRIVRLFLRLLLHHTLPTDSLLDQTTYLDVFTEVWKNLKGSRSAVYRNDDAQKHGLLSVVALLDTEDPEQFLREMRQLARFAGGMELDKTKGQKDDLAEIEKLIRDLGASRFQVRESATTKLQLLGEPALPFLEKALKSEDLEVQDRAARIKAQIVAVASTLR